MAKVTIEELRQEGKKGDTSFYKAGQTVRVHLKVKEGEKERVQIFEGLIISVNGKEEVSQTIVVRKNSGGIGVEYGFPVHSPDVQKIELVKEGKVRRSRIFYMRGLTGKAARLKERFYSEEDLKKIGAKA